MQKKRKEFPVGKMAKALKVSVSGFYAYFHRKPSLRAEKNKRLVDLIRKIHQEGRSTYGSPRIHARLQKTGYACSRKTVAVLMRKHGIAAKMRKSWKRTTKAGKRKAVKNLLN